MSEPIPLSTTLGIHRVQVIIGKAFSQRLDLMLKHLTTKSRLARSVKRQIHRHDLTRLDLFRCRSNTSRGEQVEAANLEWSAPHNIIYKPHRQGSAYIVILSPYPCSLWRRAWDLKKFFPRWKFCTVWIPGNCGSCFVHGEKVFDLRQTLTRGALLVGHGSTRRSRW